MQQFGVLILAVDRERRVGKLRHRLGRRAEHAKRERQIACARFFSTRGDDVESLGRRQIAEHDNTHDWLQWRRRVFGMRPHGDRKVGEIAMYPLRHVVGRRDHPVGAAQKLREDAAPCGDVETPLTRSLREACCAAESVRLAAIAAFLSDQMILRTDREVIMKGAIERNSHGRR